jgi:rare lipoprotein A
VLKVLLNMDGKILLQFSLTLAAVASSLTPSYGAGDEPQQFSGNVSWYGVPFHGRKTASGEIFDMYKMTCANLKLKFFTKVLVEDPKTGKSVIVKVNDRGPYACKRVMDLSKGAATSLGTISRGVAYVDCTVIDADSDKK